MEKTMLPQPPNTKVYTNIEIAQLANHSFVGGVKGKGWDLGDDSDKPLEPNLVLHTKEEWRGTDYPYVGRTLNGLIQAFRFFELEIPMVTKAYVTMYPAGQRSYMGKTFKTPVGDLGLCIAINETTINLSGHIYLFEVLFDDKVTWWNEEAQKWILFGDLVEGV
jgi:hypothetical protein